MAFSSEVVTGSRQENASNKKLSSNALDDDGWRHAAGGAHRHQAALEIAPLQLVEYSADQDRASRTDRMAEGDRAAIDVDLRAVKLEIPDELFRDDRKSLVDLEQVDIVEVRPALASTLRAAGTGAFSIKVGESPTLA